MNKLVKTQAGQDAFKARSPLLSARQRSAFLLCDGTKTVEQVMTATRGMGITRDDIEYLCQQKFLELTAGSGTPSAEAIAPAVVSTRTPQERYSMAMPLATKVTASLGLRGFRLNLSVESAAGFDDLLALLPKIQAAAGQEACAELERALKG